LLKYKQTWKSLETYCPYLPKFYVDIIETWRDTHKNLNIRTKEQISEECLWLNQKIKANNKCLYNEQGIRKGILKV
jgi:hypothetical protein